MNVQYFSSNDFLFVLTQRERIPFYSTDFTRGVCERVSAAFKDAEGPAARRSAHCLRFSAARPNPFRSPVRRYLPELAEEAAFENSFIQHLIFDANS